MRGELMMLLAGVCLCLVIISTHFTSGLYARYSTGASGSDGARVIQFRQLTITETGSFTESGSGNKQFVFTIYFNKPASSKYFLGAKTHNALLFEKYLEATSIIFSLVTDLIEFISFSSKS